MTLPHSHIAAVCFAVLLALSAAGTAHAQQIDRIAFNGQELFLNGGNVAWVDFARDIGPGDTKFSAFEEMFAEVHASGGNAMRLWLHTTGGVTPEWSGNEVVGPGKGAIEDLRAILDLAWKHEVGLQLCLWSFDMLRTSNGLGITDRARALLTDPVLTQTYIDNALIPMVDSLEGHPALLAWEIFNEPEGMSNEFGWADIRHVAMAGIQRFVNLTAGAIHRADPGALVTNGSWSMQVLTDEQTASKTALTNPAVLRTIQTEMAQRHGLAFSLEEAEAYRDRLQAAANLNYYTDDRLIAAGGDPDGTLDYYTVHYYTHLGTQYSPFHRSYDHWGLDKPLAVAEFFLPETTFGVPYANLYTILYDLGYAGALAWQWFDWYTNRVPEQENWPRALENMATMWERHREAVDVYTGFRIAYFETDEVSVAPGGSTELAWEVSGAASVTLDGSPVDSLGTTPVTPTETTTYTLTAVGRDGETISQALTIEVLAPEETNRALGRPAVASTVEACCGSTRSAGLATDGDPETRWSSAWQTGEADADPDDEWIYVDLGQVYSIHEVVLAWEAAHAGSYDLDVSLNAETWTTVLEERAGDGGTDTLVFETPVDARYVRMHGLERASEWGFSLWEFEVYGLPSASVVRYEAEDAALTGEVTVIRNAPEASGEAYVDMKNTGTITFDVTVEEAGDYPLTFGYNLAYDVPKSQFLEVNDAALGEVEYTGETGRWLTETVTVPLQSGSNKIEILKSWGWMYFDYIEVGALTPVGVDEPGEVPTGYMLAQNYPNPFNPATVIRYTLQQVSHVRLEVFDVTGRAVAVLVDEMQSAGEQAARFDAVGLASGVYLYRLTAGPFVATRQMVLVR